MAANWYFQFNSNGSSTTSQVYADFKAALAQRNFIGDVFYMDEPQTSPAYQMYIWCLSRDRGDFFSCSLYNASGDPKPSTFATDFPNAVQFGNPNSTITIVAG